MERVFPEAGILAVVADGIGKFNTGKVSAQIAVDTFCRQFRQYKTINNPNYFLKRSFYIAHAQIQNIIDERRGGASVAAVFFNRDYIYYALAGDIKIALLRNNELIPLSEGQTIDVLAQNAYKTGKITRQETLQTLHENRLWNYVGMEGFRQIEWIDRPVRIKKKDKILIMTKGIYQVLSWVKIEDIMLNIHWTASQKAAKIIEEADMTRGVEKDNGTVVILETDKLSVL